MPTTALATADDFGETPLSSAAAFMQAAGAFFAEEYPWPYGERAAVFMDYLSRCGPTGAEIHAMIVDTPADARIGGMDAFRAELSGYLG